MRGEDPAAIRIIDLSPPTREEVARLGIDYVKTDISNAQAVDAAFEKPWPKHVESLPLTVFHTIAYINAADRNPIFLPPYIKVNIEGTKNILHAAQKAGATCLIATSSASIALRPPAYFPWPWQRWPRDIYQYLPNAEPNRLDAPLASFGSCYAWSKAQAEMLVRSANTPSLLTGAIRPGHAIYGDGVENPSSVTWDYLRRGGNPTWISRVVAHFVYAQNVSIGHLAFEDALLKSDGAEKVGGKAYCVTDPNPPIVYGELYRALTTLAHPSTTPAFPNVPHILMLLLSYILETYRIVRAAYFGFLPPLSGDIAMLQPATFNMCTLHIVYSDERAREEIGYRAPITTLEGFARAVKAWNDGVERRTAARRV